MLAFSCIQRIECSGSTRCLFCELQDQSISIYFSKSKTISIFIHQPSYPDVLYGFKVLFIKGTTFIAVFQAKKNRVAIG